MGSPRTYGRREVNISLESTWRVEREGVCGRGGRGGEGRKYGKELGCGTHVWGVIRKSMGSGSVWRGRKRLDGNVR